MAVKKLKNIYPGYFQKSRVFLYPALGIKKGSVTPIQTYVSWKDEIEVTDMKLVCKFHLRTDPEFVAFEEKYLVGNGSFSDYRELQDNKAVYTFDFSDDEHNWSVFLEGKYSLFDDEHKKRIREYYGINTANYAFIHSYLYPEYYYEQYAEFLSNRDIDVPDTLRCIKEIGELCDKPNFEKETLKIKVPTLDFTDI